MVYRAVLLAVADMARAKAFYRDVLGLSVVADFGANVTLEGGVALQTLDTWRAFIETQDAATFSNAGELYFEEADFDAFAEALAARDGVRFVHPVRTHAWGQRAVRFRDPDGHIIEVAEPLRAVARRFRKSGMTVGEIAARMGVMPALAEELCGA